MSFLESHQLARGIAARSSDGPSRREMGIDITQPFSQRLERWAGLEFGERREFCSEPSGGAYEAVNNSSKKRQVG
jgi:hypothetical protein